MVGKGSTSFISMDIRFLNVFIKKTFLSAGSSTSMAIKNSLVPGVQVDRKNNLQYSVAQQEKHVYPCLILSFKRSSKDKLECSQHEA